MSFTPYNTTSVINSPIEIRKYNTGTLRANQTTNLLNVVPASTMFCWNSLTETGSLKNPVTVQPTPNSKSKDAIYVKFLGNTLDITVNFVAITIPYMTQTQYDSLTIGKGYPNSANEGLSYVKGVGSPVHTSADLRDYVYDHLETELNEASMGLVYHDLKWQGKGYNTKIIRCTLKGATVTRNVSGAGGPLSYNISVNLAAGTDVLSRKIKLIDPEDENVG